MKCLRRLAKEVKKIFGYGEVIHGEYTRGSMMKTLHSVPTTICTSLYSGHNDHNYFEIAHNVKRLYEKVDVSIPIALYILLQSRESASTQTERESHMLPSLSALHFAGFRPFIMAQIRLEGRRTVSDASLRPALRLKIAETGTTRLIRQLGRYVKSLLHQ